MGIKINFNFFKKKKQVVFHQENNELNSIKELIEKLDCRLSRLKDHGFESKNDRIFINKTRRIVAKISYISERSRNNNVVIPKHAIPTIILGNARVDEGFSGGYWKILIQPLADVSYEAACIAGKYLWDNHQKEMSEVDFHGGNYGIYNNNPVLIDW